MRKTSPAGLLISLLLYLFMIPAAAGQQQDPEKAQDVPLAPVAVSDNGKYLLKADGEPFFWLGDTAWDLHHRLTKEEITTYLEDRKAKGFSLILFRVPLNEKSGADAGNRYGEYPFSQKDIARPNEQFFELVDYSLAEMERLDLVAGFLPLWGWAAGYNFGYNISDEDVAYYGQWIGERYQDQNNIIWVSGGDSGSSRLWQTLGRALKETDPQKLVTYHPGRDGISSFHLFGDADWLDFHMVQTGHNEDLAGNYTAVEEVYQESSKPVLNGEPPYENITAGPDIFISAHQVRKAAYWSLLAGGFGHVYGDVDIFQFSRAVAGQQDTWGGILPWMEAMDNPGARQMAILAGYLGAVPGYSFVPQQDLIVSANPEGPAHIRAAQSADGSLTWIYFPEPTAAVIKLGDLKRPFSTRWMDPRTGTIQDGGPTAGGDRQEFSPPYDEDALLMFVPPGSMPLDEEQSLRENDLVRLGVIIAGLIFLVAFVIFIIRQFSAALG